MLANDSLRVQVLGPLRVWRAEVELDAGPPQQAILLAVLVASAGRPIGISDLIDLMWEGEPPASAHNVIHKYVGALRRLLQPTLAARIPGTYIIRRGTGYMFTGGANTLDLVAFRTLVSAGRSEVAMDRHEAALDSYVNALNLWDGPACEGLDYGPRAMPVFVGLNNEFFGACVEAASLAESTGRPELVLAPLQLAARIAPLHEVVQASLVSALGAAGRQAEALSVFRTVCARLKEDLGIDPGQALEAAYLRVLKQTDSPSSALQSIDPIRPGRRVSPKQDVTSPAKSLVGRGEELMILRWAVGQAFSGKSGLVLVEGEPGAGKTRLLEEIASEIVEDEAVVVWGHCLEGKGAPVMWPWVQVVESIIESQPEGERQLWLTGELRQLLRPQGDALLPEVLPDTNAQFRMFEQVVAVLGQAAAQRPVVLVVDDLHWADVASLQLFRHVAAQQPAGTTLVGALRDRAPAPSSELARTLAATSRIPGLRRVRLHPLGVAEVAELVCRETGHEPDSSTVQSIHARTAGNPFFVRELSRLLADGGAFADDGAMRPGVPSTVRDIVRDRVAGLDEAPRELLQLAALIGREVDVTLLAQAADLDIQECLDGLDPLDALALLEPAPGNASSFVFPHDLVREAVCESTPPRSANRLHVRIAQALEVANSGDDSVPERVAHHLWAAGPLADPAHTIAGLLAAGHLATNKFALESAAQHLQMAAHIARTAGLVELELSALSQLAAVVGMQSMFAIPGLDALERAEYLARQLGHEVEAAGFLFSRWVSAAQGLELDRSGQLARQLLEQGEASSDTMVRAYGFTAWGIHQWHIGEVGESYRYLNRSTRTMLNDLVGSEEDPVRHDLQLLSTGMLAETTATFGDINAANALLDELEAAGDDPYTVTIWASIKARIAVVVGDPQSAQRAAERGMAVDPNFSFVFLGTYQRLGQCWAQAMLGNDPGAAIVEAKRLLATNLLEPTRSCVAAWWGLIGEMYMVTGSPDEALEAIDQADVCLEAYGQRSAEGLLLLLRAKVLHALGKPTSVVRTAAEKALLLSTEREAHLFVHRAETFLAELGAGPAAENVNGAGRPTS